MKVEIRQIDSDRLLEQIEVEVLADIPQPGRWLVLGDRSFLVLQRRHRYRLRNGIYELAALALQVKSQRQPARLRKIKQNTSFFKQLHFSYKYSKRKYVSSSCLYWL